MSASGEEGVVAHREDDKQVRVARIGRPHGIRGEVTVQVFTDFPEARFMTGNQFSVRSKHRDRTTFRELTIEGIRWNKQILLVKFQEFSDRNTAEALRDSELYAQAADRSDDDEGWYASELVTMTVHQESLQSPAIGKVSGLINGAAQDLLKITLHNGREVLLPFVEEIVPEIDESSHAVVITPPPGLLELNQD